MSDLTKIAIPPWTSKTLHYLVRWLLGCLCIFSCCYIQPLLATAGRLTTAFWKLHLLGVVQIELPLLCLYWHSKPTNIGSQQFKWILTAKFTSPGCSYYYKHLLLSWPDTRSSPHFCQPDHFTDYSISPILENRQWNYSWKWARSNCHRIASKGIIYPFGGINRQALRFTQRSWFLLFQFTGTRFTYFKGGQFHKRFLKRR